MPKWLVGVLIVAALGLIVAFGVASHNSGSAAAVTTAVVKRSTLLVKLPENGVMKLPQTAAIAAQTSGTIVRMLAHSGERVSRGGLLVKLDDRALQAKVSSDEAAVAAADATLRKAQQGAAVAGDTSRQNVASAQQTLLAARAQLQSDVNSQREGQVGGAMGGAGSIGISGRAQLLQLRQQLQAARSNLATARETYDADRQLYNINALPRQQLDRDKASYEQAVAAADSAQQQYALIQQELHDNAGQLGSRIEADQHAVQSAQAALAAAQTQSGQDKTVDVRSAQAGVASAQAQLAFDQQQLADTEVRAPFDGVIQTVGTAAPAGGSTQLTVGDSVTAGQTLFTIAGSGSMVVKAHVDEQDIFNVRVGQHAFVTGEDFPGHTLVGTVTEIAPVVVQQTQAGNSAKDVETTIALGGRYPFLRDGMSCDVDIVTGKTVDAFVVPQSAIIDQGGKHYVFVVKAGIARKKRVAEGLKSDTEVAVSGLSGGDAVATGDLKDLKDGAKVEAAPAASAQPSAP